MPSNSTSQAISSNAPAPLLQRVGQWIWLSMVACTLCIFIPRFFSILYEPNIDYRPFGPAVFLVVLFYDFVVMYLSSRERRVILEAVRSKCEQEFLSEDDSTAIITKWNSLNFWILALCQSGMAALGLYLSARLALFWGIPTALLGNMFFEIFELVFVVTQIAMLGCIALHCVIRSAEIAAYIVSNASSP